MSGASFFSCTRFNQPVLDSAQVSSLARHSSPRTGYVRYSPQSVMFDVMSEHHRRIDGPGNDITANANTKIIFAVVSHSPQKFTQL
ncbi:hypothetical protein PO909_005942 [Leuciscus waleckii]